MRKPIGLDEVKKALEDQGIDASLFAGLLKIIANQRVQVKKNFTMPLEDPRTGDIVYKENPITKEMEPVQKVVYEPDRQGRERPIEIVEDQIDPRIAKILVDAINNLIEQPPDIKRLEVGMRKEDKMAISEYKKLLEDNPDLMKKVEAIDADFTMEDS